MHDNEALLSKKINEILYHFESKDYDQRHPETMQGDRLWWEEFGKKYIKSESVNFKILDIGSGTGLVPSCSARYLRNSFCFVCYDISENMLKEARNKLRGDSVFRFIKGDAEVLPFANEAGIVIITSAIVMIVDPKLPLIVALPTNEPIFVVVDIPVKTAEGVKFSADIVTVDAPVSVTVKFVACAAVILSITPVPNMKLPVVITADE